MNVALITGGSKGLGRAVARSLAHRGWGLVIDARGGPALDDIVAELGASAEVIAVRGDVADEAHLAALAGAVEELGGLDLLVNNASVLGPSPQPGLADYPVGALEEVYRVNVFAPLSLAQRLLPQLQRSRGVLVQVSSDAAVEAYPGWGGYGSAKAALDQLSAVLAVEHPDLGVYAFDPGDMRTALAELAFPGEDLTDRSDPEDVVPALLRLVDERPPSGRYRAGDLLAEPRVSLGVAR
jgi:NAD(P)-dependent dehydrogenase (short-subunit alcohol dehydrogenase family)